MADVMFLEILKEIRVSSTLLRNYFAFKHLHFLLFFKERFYIDGDNSTDILDE